MDAIYNEIWAYDLVCSLRKEMNEWSASHDVKEVRSGKRKVLVFVTDNRTSFNVRKNLNGMFQVRK